MKLTTTFVAGPTLVKLRLCFSASAQNAVQRIRSLFPRACNMQDPRVPSVVVIVVHTALLPTIYLTVNQARLKGLAKISIQIPFVGITVGKRVSFTAPSTFIHGNTDARLSLDS